MTDVNTLLLQQRVRHAIDLQSYSNGVVRDIISLLNQADTDLLERLANRLDKYDTWTNKRLQAVFADIATVNADNYKELANRLAAEMTDFATHEAEQTAKGIESVKPGTSTLPKPVAKQIDVAYQMTLPTAEQLAAIVSKEPITIGPDGKLLLEEIFEKLAAGKEDRIRQAVRLGMVEGETVPQIVQRLRGTRAARFADGIIETDRRNAEAMARSVVMHTSNRAAQMTYQKNSSVVKGILRLETLDKRTCVFCGSVDHTLVPIDSTQLAPFHINCRGFSSPQLKSWKELGIDLKELPPSTRASMNGQVPEQTTYPQWLRQHPQYAKEVLGPTRAKLFLDGQMPIDSFTDNKGHVLNLAQLREKQAGYFAKSGIE